MSCVRAVAGRVANHFLLSLIQTENEKFLWVLTLLSGSIWRAAGSLYRTDSFGKRCSGVKMETHSHNVTDPSFRRYLMEASDSLAFLLSHSMETRRCFCPHPLASSTDKCRGERLNEPLEIILHPRQQTNYHDYDNPFLQEGSLAGRTLGL